MGLLTLLGLGGSAYSAYKGSKAAEQANNDNKEIAELNIAASERANAAAIAEARRQQEAEIAEDRALRELQLQLFNMSREDARYDQMYAQYVQGRAYQDARRAEQEAKLGSTDAAGNRTHFVPGRGWVTDLTDTQRALQTDSEQEQQRQLRTGADRSEQIEARAVGQRSDEAAIADEAEREFRAARRPDEGALRQLFLARGGAERNRANDQIANSIGRQGIRAGGGANSALLAQMMRGASDQSSARQAGIDAQIAAMDTAGQQFAQSRDAPSQLYDFYRRMSTSGAAPPGAFSPTAPELRGSAIQTGGSGTGAIPSASMGVPNLQPINGSGSAQQALLQGLGRSFDKPYVQPDNSWSDFLGNASNTALQWAMYNQGQKQNESIDNRTGGNSGSGTWGNTWLR